MWTPGETIGTFRRWTQYWLQQKVAVHTQGNIASVPVHVFPCVQDTQSKWNPLKKPCPVTTYGTRSAPLGKNNNLVDVLQLTGKAREALLIWATDAQVQLDEQTIKAACESIGIQPVELGKQGSAWLAYQTDGRVLSADELATDASRRVTAAINAKSMVHTTAPARARNIRSYEDIEFIAGTSPRILEPQFISHGFGYLNQIMTPTEIDRLLNDMRTIAIGLMHSVPNLANSAVGRNPQISIYSNPIPANNHGPKAKLAAYSGVIKKPIKSDTKTEFNKQTILGIAMRPNLNLQSLDDTEILEHELRHWLGGQALTSPYIDEVLINCWQQKDGPQSEEFLQTMDSSFVPDQFCSTSGLLLQDQAHIPFAPEATLYRKALYNAAPHALFSETRAEVIAILEACVQTAVVNNACLLKADFDEILESVLGGSRSKSVLARIQFTPLTPGDEQVYILPKNDGGVNIFAFSAQANPSYLHSVHHREQFHFAPIRAQGNIAIEHVNGSRSSGKLEATESYIKMSELQQVISATNNSPIAAYTVQCAGLSRKVTRNS